MLKHIWRSSIRFGFRLLYNEMAWTYDVVSWLVSLGAWRDWQHATLPFVTGERVLEIGHGPGHMLLALEAAGYDVVGLDLSPTMGRLARKRVGTAVPLAQGRVQALPFAAAVFDTVLSTFPTNYIVDPETLTAVHRILRRDGRLVILLEGHLAGKGSLPHFIEWLYRITGQRAGPYAVDEGMFWPREERRRQFEQQFAATGFQIQVKRIRLKRSGATVVIAGKLRGGK